MHDLIKLFQGLKFNFKREPGNVSLLCDHCLPQILRPINPISLQRVELCSLDIRFFSTTGKIDKRNQTFILAAIGNFSLNRECWRLVTSLLMLPRLFLAWWYWTFLNRVTLRMEYVRTLIHVAAGLNVAELTSLLVLSFIDSDNRLQSHVHKIAFGGFLLFSIVFFSLQIYLFRYNNCI